MTRDFFIERILRRLYNGQPSDGASVTTNLANSYLNDAIAIATKLHYGENMRIEDISFINNSFYTTFRGLAISVGAEMGYFTAQLPEIPIALGKNESLPSIRLVNGVSVSKPCVWLNVNQVNQYDNLPQPFGIPVWNENSLLVFNSPKLNLKVNGYTVTVRMVSSASTKLSDQINVPSEYFQMMSDYVFQQLNTELMQPKDNANDGTDNK